MSDRVLQFFPTIVTTADNLIIANYNSANGNFDLHHALAAMRVSSRKRRQKNWWLELAASEAKR
jgi:hypothetical protein